MQFRLVALLGVLLWCTALPAQEPKRYYLGIGIEKYEHRDLKPLKYCVEDVTELGELLSQHGYTVKILSDDAAKADAKLAPTKANIERELEVFRKSAGAADTLILALAGHGLQFANQADAYFCPQDGLPFPDETKTLVSVGEIYRQFEKSKAGTRMILVDACRNDPDSTRGRGFDAATGPAVPTGVAALFSCAASQQALESDELKHGVFFHYVLESLRSDDQRESSGELTFDRMQAYVRKNVPTKVADLTQRARSQSPNLKADITGEPPVLLPPRLAKYRVGEVRDFTDLRLQFVYCPAGNFVMGSPSDEKDRFENEDDTKDSGGSPVRVTLTKGFWLGQTEVTQKQWFEVMGTRPWRKEDGSLQDYVKEGDDIAASYISYEDAVAYCDQLTAKERSAGRLKASERYTLPTEAQWEYACRAGTTTRFSFGDDPDYSQLGEYAWFQKNAYDADEKYAHRVGQKKANPWGLRDMHGNVMEWCLDAYQEHLEGGRDPHITGGTSIAFVLRGGSWFNYPGVLRSARRLWDGPSSRSNLIGFRLSRTE